MDICLNTFEKIVISVIIAVFVGFLIFLVYREETMTPQEKAAKAQEIAEQYAANTKSYSVVSVKEYTRTETNRYGGVEDVEICYSINYVDADGNVQTNDAFQNLPNAGRKLIRGDSDLYIIYPGNTEVLQLTDATFNKLTGNG